MTAEARRGGAKLLVIRDVWSSATEVTTLPMEAAGMRRCEFYTDALLRVVWDSFDDYLAWLPAKRRKALLRDERRCASKGISVVTTDQALSPDTTMEIHRLWCKLYEKYQDKDQIYLPAEFFGRVAALSNAMVLMAFQGGRLIGFDLLLLRGNTMESTYSGIDAEHVGSTPVHRHMGHEIIRLAIARGARSVDFGVSNEEAKARMGCELRIAHAYVLPLSPLFRWLRLDRLVMPESQRAKSEGRQPEETGNAM